MTFLLRHGALDNKGAMRVLDTQLRIGDTIKPRKWYAGTGFSASRFPKELWGICNLNSVWHNGEMFGIAVKLKSKSQINAASQDGNKSPV